MLEISVLLAIGILGDGWVYLEAHRPLLLVCLSCFGCLPPAPLLCTSQNFHIKSQSWDVNLACNPLSWGEYSSCHIRVYYLGLQQYCDERAQNYNTEGWQNFITVFHHWPPSTAQLEGLLCFTESLGEPGADQSLHSGIPLGIFFIYQCVCVWGGPFFPHGLLTTNPWGQRLKHWQRQLSGRQLQSICSTLFQSGGNI